MLRHTARLRHPPWDQEGIIDVEPLHFRIPREPPLLGLSRFPFSADTTILSITFFVLSYFLHEEEFWDRFCLLSFSFFE